MSFRGEKKLQAYVAMESGLLNLPSLSPPPSLKKIGDDKIQGGAKWLIAKYNSVCNRSDKFCKKKKTRKKLKISGIHI